MAEFPQCGRHEGVMRCFAILGELAHCATHEGLGLVLGAAAVLPVRELDEGQAGVLALAVEGEAADREDRIDGCLLVFEEVVAHHVQRLLRARQGAARRSLDQREPCRSEEHTSELQSLMRISYAIFCLKQKNNRRLALLYNNT